MRGKRKGRLTFEEPEACVVLQDHSPASHRLPVVLRCAPVALLARGSLDRAGGGRPEPDAALVSRGKASIVGHPGGRRCRLRTNCTSGLAVDVGGETLGMRLRRKDSFCKSSCTFLRTSCLNVARLVEPCACFNCLAQGLEDTERHEAKGGVEDADLARDMISSNERSIREDETYMGIGIENKPFWNQRDVAPLEQARFLLLLVHNGDDVQAGCSRQSPVRPALLLISWNLGIITGEWKKEC